MMKSFVVFIIVSHFLLNFILGENVNIKCVCANVCVYVYIYVCVCAYMCACMCMCVLSAIFVINF